MKKNNFRHIVHVFHFVITCLPLSFLFLKNVDSSRNSLDVDLNEVSEDKEHNDVLSNEALAPWAPAKHLFQRVREARQAEVFVSQSIFSSSSADGYIYDHLPCDYQGVIHLDGEEWYLSECMRCTCGNSTVKCEIDACLPLNCKNQVFTPGVCCPKCPNSKLHLLYWIILNWQF